MVGLAPRQNPGSRRDWLVTVILALWLAQVGWLSWWFAPEGKDLINRLLTGQIGAAIRQEEPFSQGLAEVQKIIPPAATYVFLDRYEAGKENKARYLLYPRRHILLNPQIRPAPLFDRLVREQAEYLIIRDGLPPAARYFLEYPNHPAFHYLMESKAGTVYRVRPDLLVGGFYD